jgi:hypothetical protein
MAEPDTRTPEELEEDLDAELLERIRKAMTEPGIPWEEVKERRLRRRTQLNAVRELTKTSRTEP